jgi:hypothetical protein
MWNAQIGVAKAAAACRGIQYVEHTEGDGVEIFKAVCQLGRFQETRRTVQVRAIKSVAESKKSKFSGSDTRCGWNFLGRERKPQS